MNRVGFRAVQCQDNIKLDSIAANFEVTQELVLLVGKTYYP